MPDEIQQKVRNFFAHYPLVRLREHTILLRPHEPVAHVYYLIEGRVDQYDISTAGNEVVVNTFQPPAFFPVSHAVNHLPNKYFFETALPVTAHAAPVDEVVAFLKNNPDVTFDLLQRVYRGTEGVLRRMAHLMGGRAQSRLVFELINAAYRSGVRQNDGSISLALHENDFAKRTGLSRETVSRAMRELKQASLVQVRARGITIVDLAKLEHAIGTDL